MDLPGVVGLPLEGLLSCLANARKGAHAGTLVRR